MIGSIVFLGVTIAAGIVTGFLMQEERDADARRLAAVRPVAMRDEWERFGQLLGELGLAIGVEMLPAMEKLGEAFALLARGAAAWTESVVRHPLPGETTLEWWHRQIDREKASR